MPIPEPHTPWPPPAHQRFHTAYERWAAWYEGDREALARVYGGASGHRFDPKHHPSTEAGGVVGAIARWFWGQPVPTHQRSPKVHVPVAADIASTSANLLFAEPPALTVPEDEDGAEAAQARLDELFDERAWAQLLNAAEIETGIGGAYLRVGWDSDVVRRPLLTVIGPESAVPTFRWGHLAEVTFVWQLGERDGGVLRHLEHHSAGRVEHALMLGQEENLGRLLPLTDHPSTEGLVVDAEGGIATGIDMLDVVYVPFAPHRGWRNDPVGQHLGRPAIAGVEPLMDALDEIYTAWMRDVRLAKARAVVPQTYLQSLGPGRGADFDLDRELFVGVSALAGTDQMPLHVVQPDIRHEQHAATAMALYERVVVGAGFSAQTFGLTGEVAMTAAESFARERKTHHTRGGQVRRWASALADLAVIMLAVDAEVFGSGVPVIRPDVEFPPMVRDNPEAQARTAQLLFNAESASTETRVRVVHPSWDQEQIAEEVAAIERQALAGEAPPLFDPTGEL